MVKKLFKYLSFGILSVVLFFIGIRVDGKVKINSIKFLSDLLMQKSI